MTGLSPSRGVTIIHHGPKEPASNRGSGGVAIMLGPRAQRAWRAAGSPDPYCPGNIVDNTTRYMGIDLLFHPRKNQPAKFFVACVYAPYSEMENTHHPGIITKFYRKNRTAPSFSSHLTRLLSSEVISMPRLVFVVILVMKVSLAHMAYHTPTVPVKNSSILRATAASEQAPPTSNIAATEPSMTSETTMLPINWTSFSYINAMVLMSLMRASTNHETTLSLITTPLDSNYALFVTYLRARNNNKSQWLVNCWLRTPSTGPSFETHPICTAFQDKVDAILQEYADCETHEATPTQLSNAIMYAAECTITEAKDPTPNWFDANESFVRPLRDAAQCAYKSFLADGSDAKE